MTPVFVLIAVAGWVVVVVLAYYVANARRELRRVREATHAAEDVALSDAMNAYWTAFARTGNPGSAGGPAWPNFDLANEGQIEFGAEGPKVRDHFLKPWRDFVEASVGK